MSKSFAYFVWLPRATSSPCTFVNLMDVNAIVLPTAQGRQYLDESVMGVIVSNLHLSQLTSALIVSPTLPPEPRYVTIANQKPRKVPWESVYGSPLKSVDTPVANKPREATANEPPRSAIQANVPR